MNSKRYIKLLFFTLVFLQFQVKAQIATGKYTSDLMFPGDLTVGSGVNVTVDNCTLTVTGNLILNGNIYLRNGGQLVQIATGANANSGGGFLSLYQEGKADHYSFNYWCSPVHDGSGKFGISMLGSPNADGVNMTLANTVTNGTYDGTASPLHIEPYWINTFSPLYGANQTYNDWHNEGANVSILPGYGFSMKGCLGTDSTSPGGEGANNPDGTHQRYEFRGIPNNGDISALLSAKPAPATNFTLIGNPYPSAIDLRLFFRDQDNFDTDQAAYFWEQGPTSSHYISQYTGGYGAYAPFGLVDVNNNFLGVYVPATFFSYNGDGSYNAATGVANPGNPDRRFAPIGQGFMVRTDLTYNGVGADNKVIMKNSFRVFQKEGTGSIFSRKKEDTAENILPQIRFNTTYDGGAIGQMVQVFRDGSTTGIDKGQDIMTPNNSPTQVNFLVDDQRCVISTVPFDIKRKIPLIFDNQAQANYKITVQEITNLDQVSNVYLHDIVSDQYYDIKNNFYEFTLPAGMNYERYEITFQSNMLGIDDLTEKAFDIFQNNTMKKLLVSNPLQKELIACDLYDIAGKMIFSKKQLGAKSSYEFSTAELSDGVYIVRVTSQENKSKGQKVIVRN